MSQKPVSQSESEEPSTETEATESATPDFDIVSNEGPKADAKKFVTGDAKYTADYEFEFQNLAHGKIVRSKIAHGYVKDIDTSEAEAMDGVYAVLTPWSEEIPDKRYTSAGQSYMEPSPYDMKALREKVRYVGDPIAAVAAKDQETADRAARQIDVEYEELEPLLDFKRAMDDDAPQLFDPEEVENKQPGHDYDHNLETHLEGEIGDVETALAEAEEREDATVVEDEYFAQYQSHALPEPHTTIVYRNEDNRYHVITSTQVPNHVRRMLAQLYEVPIGDVRVTKPALGCGFGGKQTLLLEPVVWALHEATEMPVKIEVSRREEFQAMRFRREASVEIKAAVTDDGEMLATDFQTLANSGAYGPHGLTVTSSIGTKPLPLYPHTPNVRFVCDAVHTNKPVPGAQRGYGNPQGTWALESHITELALAADVDPLEFRQRHHVREGDENEVLGITAGESSAQIIQSCGLEEAIERGREAINYDDFDQPADPNKHRAIGVALTRQGSGVAGDELSAAQIKMNEDGTFILQTGAVDIGSGADSAMAKIAAEALGVTPDDIVVESSDTDTTPHDYGTYASSTTYISGNAVKNAAEDITERIKYWAQKMLEAPEGNFELKDGKVVNTGTGDAVTLEEIGYESIYGEDEREHIMGQGHFSTDISPTPYGVQFVDVTVDDQTGEFEINKLLQAMDVGTAIDPGMAEGQIEGSEMMALEYATEELLTFDEDGNPDVQGYRDYGMPRATDMPEMETILVEPHDPTGPFGAKSVGEVPVNPLPPALANAIRRAVGVRITDLPITAEKIKAELDAQ